MSKRNDTQVELEVIHAQLKRFESQHAGKLSAKGKAQLRDARNTIFHVLCNEIELTPEERKAQTKANTKRITRRADNF